MRTLTADQQRVKDLVEVFNTPIVFHPGGWDESLPEWMRLRVITERVAMVENGGWKTATDAEVSCYLFTASMVQPLGSDWTMITLYQAAKQMPQLYQVLPATPKELSDYQKRELEDLKQKIRNSQLNGRNKGKKEVTMPKRKLVIDEKEGSVLMGVMKEGADPVIKTVEGTLENALTAIPKLIEEAEAKWAISQRNPAYKAPPEPKKETKTAAKKPAAGKTAEELPLLSGTEAEAVAEDKAPQVEVVVTPAPEQPAAVVVAGEEKTAMSKMAEQAPAVPAAAPQTPSPAPAATPAAPAGQFQYQLKDGRGPFNTVQEAMDAMGLDKATRPQHNRWDRLSTSLKDTIRRVEKKV